MKIQFALLALQVTGILSCHSGEKGDDDYVEPKNYYETTKNIYGTVNGLWTKDKGPYFITGETRIADHDTLVIDKGAVVINCSVIRVEHGAALVIRGTKDEPAIISWKNEKTANNCVGFIYLHGGSISTKNAIVSSIIDAIPVDDSMSIRIENTTMINSMIHMYLSGFWRDSMPRMVDVDNGFNRNIYAPRITVNKSIISTLANTVDDDTAYWIGFKEGITRTDSIKIDSSCIYDFTKAKKTKLFFIDLGSGDQYSDSIVSGDYNGYPEFVNYPENDGLDSGTYDVANYYDALNNTMNYDLHVQEGTQCSNYGAYK